MSPGGTMARVYTALKSQILSGAFAPGDRLDAGKLSVELAASVTPVRDVLHRLTGERLIDSWQQEGFRMPVVTEVAVRDLYDWSGELLVVVTRSAQRHPAYRPRTEVEAAMAEGPINLSDQFLHIAECSPNFEHRAAVANLNDRSHALRIAEAVLVDDIPRRERLAAAVASRDWSTVRDALGALHRARLRQASEIAAVLRPREGPERLG